MIRIRLTQEERKQLTFLRLNANLTIKELAGKLGISPRNLSAYENTNITLPKSLIDKLEVIYEQSLSHIGNQVKDTKPEINIKNTTPEFLKNQALIHKADIKNRMQVKKLLYNPDDFI